MRIPAATLAGLAGLAVATPAMAEGNATGSARIRATVPEVCTISANQFVLTQDGQVSGTVQEFCNSNAGYQVAASHRPLEAGEVAALTYDGLTRGLDRSGLSFVTFRAGQRIDTITVTIDAKAIDAPLALAFTVVPV